MDLTREAPLRGIVLREERDTLVVQASVDEVQRFARAQRGREVRVEQATLRMRVGGTPTLHSTAESVNQRGGGVRCGYGAASGVLELAGLLYDRHGRPVAYVRDVRVHTETLDVSAMGDTWQTMMPGRTSVDIRAEGVPGLTVR